MRRELLLSLGALLGLAACSGGSSGGSATISGLAGPSQMSVITADDEVGGGPPAGSDDGQGDSAPAAGDFPPGSDYLTDEADLHVYDPSMESLGTINEILCMTSMTAYSRMVNDGPYTALVSEALCAAGQQEDGSQGQSAGGAEEWMVFTVNSRRPAAGADQTVSFWVPSDDDTPDAGDTIYAQMVLTRGVSAANPFAEFDLDFAMPLTHGDLATDPGMHGTLRTIDPVTGEIGFQFFSEFGDVDVAHAPGDESGRERIVVEMDVDQTTGAANLEQVWRRNDGGGDSGRRELEWEVVYDETHLKRRQIVGGVPGPTVTLDREDFDDRVWRYNLYHNQGPERGERVDLESGFGFRTQAGEYGWIGYWGLWVPDGAVVADGDTVTRDDHSDQDGDAYTLVMAPGKLIKNTRQAMDLADLGGQVFEWWEGGDHLHVDHDGVDFRRTQIWDDIDQEWDDITPPTVIDVNAAGGWLNMWNPALGGPVSYVDGDAFVTYFEQAFVNGASDLMLDAVGGHVQLLGLVQCLDTDISGADAEAGNIFLADAPDTSQANAHMYQFGEDDLTLYHDPNQDKSVLEQVGLGAGQEPTSGPYTWGMRSGPLVQELTGLANVWDIWNVSEFYVYETGHNPWNQYAAVEDGLGADVVFDAPLQFLYTHLTANDRNGDASYDGHKYVLQYGGPGDLWGIPHEGVDLTGNGQPDRWYPLFSLADCVEIGPTGSEYVLRATEIERTLREDPGGAPGLDIGDAAALTLPTSALYLTPNMGPKPSVSGPPAVINGQVVAD